ncbi:MAG: hypothetical protein ACE5JM_00380 [Armatimonadota bacterium]
MKCRGHTLMLLVALALPVRADLVSERWAASDSPASHPGALKIESAGAELRLVFGLSALPARAQVYHASLHCFGQDNVQPTEPALIVAAGGDEPLELAAPWSRSFDATEAVRAARGEQLALDVRRFDGLDAPRTHLDIRYEGTASGEIPQQVSGVKAVHHHGQTFVIWRELPDFQPPPGSVFWVSKFNSKLDGNETAKEPGEGYEGHDRVPAIDLATLREMQGLASESIGRGVRIRRVREIPPVTYRVYRHSERITGANLKDAEMLGEAEPFCGYDEKMRRISYRGEFLQQQEIGESIIPTYCYQDRTPVQPGEALYVHTPAAEGKAYYAVTAVLAGAENTAIGPDNSLAGPIQEAIEPPRPVLQRLQVRQMGRDVFDEDWYLFWPARGLSNIPRGPDHVIVTVPAGYTEGAPMGIQRMRYGGGFNLVDHATKGAIKDGLTLFLAAVNNLCYSDGLDTLKSFRQSKVDYFSERYILSLIRWCQDKYRPQRSGLPGNMLHFGVRHPEFFGMLSFGYTAPYDYQWSPGWRSLGRLLGPREMAVTVDGEPAWEQFNLGWYLKTHPERDIPFLLCHSSTGKDRGHTSEFGWQDDPRGWAALRDGRQNFMAFWRRVHTLEAYVQVPKMKWDKSVPAFSNCSLDDNPGSGDPSDGDPFGQINGYLLWEYETVVDEPGRWEMTVYVTGDCPRDECTVDVTPRRLASFNPRPGEKLKWANTSFADDTEIQSGEVTADEAGLVTLAGTRVSKSRNRIRIMR